MSHDLFFDPPTSDSSAAPASDFELQHYLDILRRRWKLIAACALVGLAVGVVHYQITPRMYRATTVLQIEQRSQDPSAMSAQRAYANWWNAEFYPTQYRLLESRGLAELVVRNLRLPEDPFFNPSGARAAASGSSGTPTTSADDDVALARMANKLRGGLSVDPVKRTQMVTLSYRSLNREFATRVINGYADAYIDWGISERSGEAERGSAFLASEIDTLKLEIQDKEAQLQTLTLNSDAIVVDAEGSSMVTDQLDSLNQSYSDAVRERVQKEARFKELAEAPQENVADQQSGGIVQELRGQQLLLERQYESQLKTYKPEWPAMVELKANIDKGRENLDSVIEDMATKGRQNAYAEYQAALRQEQSLQREMSRLRGSAMNQNIEAVEIANLRSEIRTRRGHLEQFYQAQSDTEASARYQQTKVSNVRVVDRALVPGSPYQPNLNKDLVAGLAAGLGAGVLLALLLHYLDRTIKTAEQAERLLGLPVLAVIADVASRKKTYGYGGYAYSDYGYSKKRKGALRKDYSEEPTDDESTRREIELIPDRHPRMGVSEAYRSLRAALLMSTANELGVVALTSAESGEGKSSTACNLAVVIAQLGKRVLIIDADLRRPRLHQILGVSNRTGLVACLTSGADIREAALPTGVDNLDILPSGPIPPNPSELLASPRMVELVRAMRSHYDMVIIDSPPVLAVSDPLHIGAVADGMVFCIASNSTHKEHCVTARDRLAMAEVKMLGTVLNRYDSTQKGTRQRYYYYEQYYSSSETAADSAA